MRDIEWKSAGIFFFQTTGRLFPNVVFLNRIGQFIDIMGLKQMPELIPLQEFPKGSSPLCNRNNRFI
jgi:hypothetical protein